MGNDPPGQFTRALHPRVGRHGDPPANVIPIGRSVIVPGERLAAERHPQPAGDLPDQARARAGAVRRPPPARADDARHLHLGARDGDLPDRRHAPCVGRPRLDEARDARLGLSREPDRSADRRVRARARLGRALAAGRVRDRPERGADPGGRRPGRPRAHGHLRRPPGDAQGAAGAAARLARDPPPHRRPAPDLRLRPARGAAAPQPAAGLGRRASTSSASCRRRS